MISVANRCNSSTLLNNTFEMTLLCYNVIKRASPIPKVPMFMKSDKAITPPSSQHCGVLGATMLAKANDGKAEREVRLAKGRRT